MFIDNKYTKWYMSIIESAKTRERSDEEYYERHHIVPKSLGGRNNKENLVSLTAREHFICHMLLVKMVEIASYKRSMSYALITMSASNGGARRRKISAREFELAKKIAKHHISGVNNGFYGKGKLIAGDKNPMYGKPCYYNMTEKEKQSWKNAISKGITGAKNPFYGKTHTETTKAKLSKHRSIPIRVTFDNGSVLEFEQYKHLGTHLGKSGELGAKLCKDENKHLLSKYGIVSIIKIKGTTS
jgi:hypothetical protein